MAAGHARTRSDPLLPPLFLTSRQRGFLWEEFTLRHESGDAGLPGSAARSLSPFPTQVNARSCVRSHLGDSGNQLFPLYSALPARLLRLLLFLSPNQANVRAKSFQHRLWTGRGERGGPDAAGTRGAQPAPGERSAARRSASVLTNLPAHRSHSPRTPSPGHGLAQPRSAPAQHPLPSCQHAAGTLTALQLLSSPPSSLGFGSHKTKRERRLRSPTHGHAGCGNPRGWAPRFWGGTFQPSSVPSAARSERSRSQASCGRLHPWGARCREVSEQHLLINQRLAAGLGAGDKGRQ
ncbi:uncharacterized protein LOC110401985 [Numida meleagris]|uniref:uncharacterized protein LOC110401985 n=1 Tax=Numida meleagris TaxID=8996 RepID=UPI000B3E3A15|nr:uncharacterized protein LOC110401985 [Numida meleagris]